MSSNDPRGRALGTRSLCEGNTIPRKPNARFIDLIWRNCKDAVILGPMKLFIKPRAIAATAVFVSFAGTALAQSFTLPHILEQNGAIVGIAWDLKGGQTTVVGQNAAGQPIPGWQDLNATFSLYDNYPIFALFTDAIGGNPHTGTFDTYAVTKTQGDFNLSNRFTVEIEGRSIVLPGCDGDSKDPGAVQASFRFVRIIPTSYPGQLSAARTAAKKQKLWSPANYRLSIGGKVVPRAMTVSPISLNFSYADVNGDGKPDVTVDSSNIAFTLPGPDAGDFNDAFKKTQAGQPTILPLELDYLDDDGNPLVILTENVMVTSVGPASLYLQTDPQAPVQVVCEKKGLNAVNVKKA
jgi:hypothetical protein